MSRKAFTRTADFEPEDDSDLVPVVLSSECPVDRGSYVEILSHRAEHVDLGRSPLPLLLGHDTGQLNIGVVEDLRVEDRKLRGRARFGASARAQEVLRDIKGRVYRSASIGYQTLARLGQRTGPDGLPQITFSFQPYECSVVAVPADPSAGFFRSGDFTMSDNTTPASGTRGGPADRERERIESLEKLGDIFHDHGGRDLAQQLVRSGGTPEQMQSILLERAGRKCVPTLGEIGMSPAERRQFSIARLVSAIISPQDRRAQADAAFEFECSDAALKAEKRALRAGAQVTIPYDVLAHAGRRDLIVATSTMGGYTVGTDTLGGSMVELLKNKTHALAAGATVLSGLQGSVAIPTLATSATAYWVGENTAPTEGAMVFGQITMNPKTLGAYVDVSRRLVIQASLDVESFIRRELTSQVAVELDRVILNGAGTGSEPLGILASTSVGTTTAGANGAAPTWQMMVDLETAVANANADQGSLAYFTNSKVRGKLKTVVKSTSAVAGFIWAGGEMPVNDYRTFVTNQIPSNLTKGTSTALCSAAIFGNWQDVILGQWGGGIDLQVDPYTGSNAGTVRIVALTDVDVLIRRAGSFQVIKDLLTS